jgi:hypothetical protein
MKHTAREPIITTDRPCWHYEEPVTGREMTYTMGYITGDLMIPCMALFAGKDNTPILIPVDVLAHAVGLAAVRQHAEDAIAKATKVVEAMDPVAVFIREETHVAPDASNDKTALYIDYKSWCVRVGHMPLSARKFNLRVQQRVSGVGEKTVRGRPHWVGVMRRPDTAGQKEEL